MSQKTVHLIIGRLLTDEEYRYEFLRRPFEFLDGLRRQGFELTKGEIDALLGTDRTLWTEAARRLDPRLQRISLHDQSPAPDGAD
jgi:hypothetical protein